MRASIPKREGAGASPSSRPWWPVRRPVVRVAIGLAIAVVLLAASGPIGIALREGPAPEALPEGVAGRLVDVAGHRVHVVEAGEGAPVVLVHGFGGTTCDWEEHLLPVLAERFHVVAIDLFGNGWSARDPSFHYGWPLWDEQLAGTLDALGIERASLVGHSMGGAAAAHFTAHHPDRVARLVLADALYPLEDDEIALPFRALATPIVGEVALGFSSGVAAPGISQRCLDHSARTYAVEGSRAGWLDYVRDPERRTMLAEAYPMIQVPTLVVHGTADTFVPIAAMRRTAPSIAAAHIVELEGGGHFPHRDAPDALLREAEPFLQSP